MLFRSEALIQNSATFFIQNISNSIYSAKKTGTAEIKGFTMMGFKVSPASYQTFIEEQRKNFEAFLKLAAFEEKSKSEAELKTAVILNAHTLTENDDKHLEALANTLGEVVNI